MVRLRMVYIFLLLPLSLLAASTNVRPQRQLFWKLNPGGAVDATVIHIRSEGTNDTIHYILGLMEKPSFLVAVTAPSSNITIDWDKLMSGSLDKSIDFHPRATFTYGFTINRIFEIYGENEYWPEYTNGIYSWDMSQFSWSPQPVEIGEKGCPLRFEFLGENYVDHYMDEQQGTVSLVLKIFNEDGFDTDEILWHTMNSSLLQISLKNFEPYFQNHSRFGVEMVVASDENDFFKNRLRKKEKNFENLLPDYFQVFEFLMPHGLHMKKGGFLQWHRMAFTSLTKSIHTVITTHQQRLKEWDSYDVEDVLLQAYYGSDFIGAHTQAFNVTFGFFGQKYYDKVIYLSWSFVFGYGSAPPSDINWILAIVHVFGFSLISIMMTCCCCL